jgi:type IV pilus assembly protein PilF
MNKRMKKSILFVWALLLVLPGCVTETTYIGKDAVRNNVDLQSAAKTRLNLGMGYLAKGDMTQAKFNLEKAYQFDPHNPDIHLAKAYYFQKVGDMKSAEASYLSLISLNSANPDAHNNYGVFLCGLKRYTEADEHFQLALAQPEYIRMDDTYENGALCAIQAGNQQKAAGYYDLALGYSPNRGKLLLEAADLALKMNNPGKAAGYMQRYSKGGKSTPQSLWLNLELAQTQGELAQLHKYGSELVQQFPKSDQAKRYLNNDY